jgi:hypothetical protein
VNIVPEVNKHENVLTSAQIFRDEVHACRVRGYELGVSAAFVLQCGCFEAASSNVLSALAGERERNTFMAPHLWSSLKKHESDKENCERFTRELIVRSTANMEDEEENC